MVRLWSSVGNGMKRMLRGAISMVNKLVGLAAGLVDEGTLAARHGSSRWRDEGSMGRVGMRMRIMCLCVIRK